MNIRGRQHEETVRANSMESAIVLPLLDRNETCPMSDFKVVEHGQKQERTFFTPRDHLILGRHGNPCQHGLFAVTGYCSALVGKCNGRCSRGRRCVRGG